MTEQIIEIKVAGLVGKLYSLKGQKWCFEFGGFYNWFLPLDKCIEKAEEQMKRVASLRVELEFKKIKRKYGKDNKRTSN